MAAAAVAVVGYGTAVVVFDRSGEESSDAGVSSTVQDEAPGGAESGDSAGPPASGPTPQAPYAEIPDTIRDQLASLPRVRPEQVREDLRRLTSQPAAARRDFEDAAGPLACGPMHRAAGEHRLLATYAGRVMLVLGYPSTDGVRRVEMFDCEGPEPRRAVVSVTFEAEE